MKPQKAASRRGSTAKLAVPLTISKLLWSTDKLCGDPLLDPYFANARTEEEKQIGIDMCNRCPELEACKEYVKFVGDPLTGVIAGEYHKPDWGGKRMKTMVAYCRVCGNEFYPRISHGGKRQMVCSRKCKGIYQTGKGRETWNS